MNDENLRYFLPDQISDEVAFHLVKFFHDLAYAIDSIYFAHVMRYEKSIEELHKQIIKRVCSEKNNPNNLPDPPF